MSRGFITPFLLVTLAVMATLAGIGGYFFYTQKTSQEAPSKPTMKIVTPAVTPVAQMPPPNPEIIFADKLSSCVKYRTTFRHAITGETLEKEVLGIINGKCEYVEQMPNNGKMVCKYTESERQAVAQYYKDVASAGSFGTSVNTDLGSGKRETKYVIDGREVVNPLQEAMTSGICVISGY